MQKALQAYSTAQLYYNQLEPIMWSIDSKNWGREAVTLNKDGTLEHLNSGFFACFYRWMVGSTPCQLLIRKFYELNEQVASASTKNKRKVTKLPVDESYYVTVRTAIKDIDTIKGYAKHYINCLANDYFIKANRYPTAQKKYEAIKRYLDSNCALDAITRPQVLDQIISLSKDAIGAAARELKQAQKQAKWDPQSQTIASNIRDNIDDLDDLIKDLSRLRETY